MINIAARCLFLPERQLAVQYIGDVGDIINVVVHRKFAIVIHRIFYVLLKRLFPLRCWQANTNSTSVHKCDENKKGYLVLPTPRQ